MFKKRAETPPQEAERVEIDGDVTRLLKKLKKIEIVSNHIADETFSGQYKSVFRGQGIEFDEVREYAEGDDVRAIDWNVTARSGRPYVKQFSEERERSMIIMLDVSASNLFGGQTSRLETATETAASLMFSALKNNDKIGLFLFANGPHKFFPPRKGRNYALRLMREMLLAQPKTEPTDIETSFEFLNKTLKKRAAIFVISDFYVSFNRNLTLRPKQAEIVAISINEPIETSFPDVGFVTLLDPETGATIELDSGSFVVRQAIKERILAQRFAIKRKLKEARIDVVDVENGGDYVKPLREFFQKRRRR